MKVLVIVENKVEREDFARSLRHAKHVVVPASDMAAAVGFLEREPVDAIIVSWPATGGPDMIRSLRNYGDGRHVYVLVILDRHAPSVIPTLFAAGADDFARRPVSREELVGRVEAPERIRSWSSPPPSISYDWSTALDARNLRACHDMGRIVVDDLAQMFGDLALTDGWDQDFAGEVRGATIPLSLVLDRTEVRVSIVLPVPALRAAGSHLLGDENASTSALDDVLRELANVAGGAVKRVALEEHVSMTPGLPANGLPASKTDDTIRRWTARQASGVVIGIVGEVRLRENQYLPAARLAEGMVVARDLKNDSGALIVSAGTRLTATTAERVGRLLGERFVVEVACTA